MIKSLLRRLWLAVYDVRLSAENLILKYRSTVNSYQLLPISTTSRPKPQAKMGFTISRHTSLILALFLIFITGSVSTAFVLRAANLAGKRLANHALFPTN